jgi:hypothetical protein
MHSLSAPTLAPPSFSLMATLMAAWISAMLSACCILVKQQRALEFGFLTLERSFLEQAGK